jgi:hypothetical protein
MLPHEDRRWFAAALRRLVAEAAGPNRPPD